jgi:hypothetical protein
MVEISFMASFSFLAFLLLKSEEKEPVAIGGRPDSGRVNVLNIEGGDCRGQRFLLICPLAVPMIHADCIGELDYADL